MKWEDVTVNDVAFDDKLVGRTIQLPGWRIPSEYTTIRKNEFTPSTNLLDAWKVVEAVDGAMHLRHDNLGEWLCHFASDEQYGNGIAANPMLAICEAALDTKGLK